MIDPEKTGQTPESAQEAVSFANWLLVFGVTAVACFALLAITPLDYDLAYALLLPPVVPFLIALTHLRRQLRLERAERMRRGVTYQNALTQWALNERPGTFWLIVTAIILVTPFLFTRELDPTFVRIVRSIGLGAAAVGTLIVVWRRHRG